jgi:hydrogenase maturation protease
MTMAPSTREKLLLIGYGNTLRGDDGVGPHVARVVAGRHRDKVRACVVLQLTPELCVALAEHDVVIFVDANAVDGGDGCRLLPVETMGEAGWSTHIASPASLLALAVELYGARPLAWCLAVPGEDFRLGAELSAPARLGAGEAVKIIEEFLRAL